MPEITTSFRNINVIKKLDVPAMQEILQQHSLIKEEGESIYVFPSKMEYEKFLRNIDLPVFLGAPSYQKFNCPFCGKPMGYISYYDQEERWIYTCFAESKSHNIIGIVQRIANCRFSQAVAYINQIYNVAHTDDSPLIRTLEENMTTLTESGLWEKYPRTKRYLGQYRYLLMDFYMALRTRHSCTLQTKTGEDIIMLTVSETCRILNIRDDDRARTFLRWITLLGYIDAVQIDELCGEDVARLEHISGYGQYEFASIYRIKLLDATLLEACEETAEKLRQQRPTKEHMTLKTIYALTSENKEDYSIVSPNFSARRRNKANLAAEEAMRIYSGILRQEMARSGYICERNIVQSIPVVCQGPQGQFRVNVAWKEIRSGVIKRCGWRCVSANRDLLKRLGLENGRLSGNIIVPAEMAFSAEEAVGAVLNEIALHGYALLAEHIPVSKQNRKKFRDMLSVCGVKSVRLNDTYRKQYGIQGEKGCVDILIDANDIQNQDKA